MNYRKTTPDTKKAWFTWTKIFTKATRVIPFVAGYNAGYEQAKEDFKNGLLTDDETSVILNHENLSN